VRNEDVDRKESSHMSGGMLTSIGTVTIEKEERK